MKIGVIMGGTSSEKEISLLTGREMIENLDKNKYEIVGIEINTKKELVEEIEKERIDFALIALHGKFGEDGGAQAIIEGIGVPYSGAGMVSSSLCMNKDISKRLMKSAGITTPSWVCITKYDKIDYEALSKIGYPLVVKPATGGSSIGTSIAKNSEEIVDAVLKAFDYDEEIIIEKYIQGTEITCCILDGKLLTIILIKPAADFFDYKSKYFDKGTEEIVVQLERRLQEKVEAICNECWSLFKCQVYARIDIIVADEQIYVLEINTLPGMTKNSLFPRSAAAANINFKELLDNIIGLSLRISR